MAYERGSIQVEGLKEINQKLKAFDKDDATMANANYEAAQLLIKKALPAVPVVSGALKASLKPSKTRAAAQVRAGNARVPYANPIHWGWFFDKKHNKRKNIRPNPFLANTLKYNYPEIIANYKKNAEILIKKYNL
jgi:hypothetical protein